MYAVPNKCARFLRTLQNQRGYSLAELIIGIGVMGIFSYLLSLSFTEIYKTGATVTSLMDVSHYRASVKNAFKERTQGSGFTEQSCMNRLAPRIEPQLGTIMSNLITQSSTNAEATARKAARVDLGEYNVLGDDLNYGAYRVNRSYLQNFYLLTSSRVYRKNAPGEVQRTELLRSRFVIQILQADLFVELTGPKNKFEVMKPIRVNLAVQSTAGGDDIIDCAYGQVANAISHIEACKVLGSDFEFIYDRFDGNENSGQCYAPLYDPVASAANGATLMAEPTGYTPIRGVLCQLVLHGKSYTFPFCTGVN